MKHARKFKEAIDTASTDTLTFLHSQFLQLKNSLLIQTNASDHYLLSTIQNNPTITKHPETTIQALQSTKEVIRRLRPQ